MKKLERPKKIVNATVCRMLLTITINTLGVEIYTFYTHAIRMIQPCYIGAILLLVSAITITTSLVYQVGSGSLVLGPRS